MVKTVKGKLIRFRATMNWYNPYGGVYEQDIVIDETAARAKKAALRKAKFYSGEVSGPIIVEKVYREWVADFSDIADNCKSFHYVDEWKTK